MAEKTAAPQTKVQMCFLHVGTQFILAEPWTFDVFYEHRNATLMAAAFGSENDGEYGQKLGQATLPTGTKLTIDRIYLRKGKQEYNSITFWIASCPEARYSKKRIRFWAKLYDVNKIICFPVGSTPEIIQSLAPFSVMGERTLEIE